MTTQPNSDRELAEKIVESLWSIPRDAETGIADEITPLITQHLSPERAAKDAEIAYWKQRFEWLANDALTALAGHTPTPVETYKDAPHCLSGDIRRLIQEKDAEIQQLKADCAVKDEALKELHNELNNPDTCAATFVLNNIIDKALSTNPGSELLKEVEELRKDKEELRDVIVECSGCGNAVHTANEAVVAIQYIRGRLNDVLDAAMRKDK